jgi:TatD DNase family protein
MMPDDAGSQTKDAPMFVDAHAHLDMYDESQITEVVESIEQIGILTLSVSVDVASFLRTAEIAGRSNLIVPGLGIHPSEAPFHRDSLDVIEHHLTDSPYIGEIGLDHLFVTDESLYAPQRDVFERFLRVAREQDKFVNIHCVGAEYETVEVMRSHGIERAIIHWYSGPPGALRQLLGEGYMFSISAEVLRSDHIRGIARTIPIDQLLTETDNPGGPEWLTGDRGQPELIVDVVAELARVRRMEPDVLARTVRSNMARFLEHDPYMAPWLEHLEP